MRLPLRFDALLTVAESPSCRHSDGGVELQSAAVCTLLGWLRRKLQRLAQRVLTDVVIGLPLALSRLPFVALRNTLLHKTCGGLAVGATVGFISQGT